MITKIFLVTFLTFFLDTKFKKTIFSFLLLISLNSIYLYFHFISKSNFISLVLIIFSTLSIYIFFKNNEILFSKQKFTIYIVINIILLTFLFNFNINPSDNNPKWFFQNDDNFADSVKLIVTFDYFFDEELTNIKNLNLKFLIVNPYYKSAEAPPINLPDTKFLNEYSLNAELENYSEKCTYIKEIEKDCVIFNSDKAYNYFSLPPLHLLFKTLLAYFLSLFQNVTVFILFSTFLTIFGLFKLYKYYFPNKYILIFILHLTSFPFLFSIQRGNFVSTFLYIGCAHLFFRYYFSYKFNFFDVLLLGLIINVRPTFLILLIIFLDFKNIKYSLYKIIQIIIFTGVIFYFSLIIAKQFHNLYNFEIFLKMINYFSDFNIFYQYYSFEFTSIKPQTFNNGLYPLLLNLKYSILFLFSKLNIQNIEKLFSATNLYLFSNFLIFINLVVFLFKNKKYVYSKKNIILISTCSVLLIGPYNGDYHLILLLIPFALFLLENNRDYTLYIILFIFLIKPHSAIYPIYGISISTVVNSFLLTFLIIHNIFFQNKIKNFKNSPI